MEEHPEALRVEEVSQLSQVSSGMACVLLKYSKPCGVKVGRMWRVPRDKVDRFLHSKKPE